MPFRMLTHDGLKIAVPVTGVRYVGQNPDSPEHSVIYIELDAGKAECLSIDEDFHTVLSRLNTL